MSTARATSRRCAAPCRPSAASRRVAFVPRAAAFAADRRATPLLLQLLDDAPAAATALLPGAKLGQRDTAPRLRAADPRYEAFSMTTLRGRLQAAVRGGGAAA